jgi:hypothetical protein
VICVVRAAAEAAQGIAAAAALDQVSCVPYKLT